MYFKSEGSITFNRLPIKSQRLKSQVSNGVTLIVQHLFIKQLSQGIALTMSGNSRETASQPILDERTVVVKSLHQTTLESHLKQLLGKFGRVVWCKVLKDKYGEHMKMAFVHFDSAQSVTDAIDSLNLTNYRDRILILEKYIPNKCSEEPKPEEDRPQAELVNEAPSAGHSRQHTIVVTGLHPKVDDKKLMEMFIEFGPILSVKVVYDRVSGRSRKYGYVNFARLESVDKAIKQMNSTKYMGNYLIVKTYVSPKLRTRRPDLSPRGGESTTEEIGYARRERTVSKDSSRCRDDTRRSTREPSKGRETFRRKEWSRERDSSHSKVNKSGDTPSKSFSGTSLQVTNLGKYDNEDKLKQLFADFGDITGVEISADKKADSGYVWFADPMEAEKACKFLDGMPVGHKRQMSIKQFGREYGTIILSIITYCLV